jgi:hypothetical protein
MSEVGDSWAHMVDVGALGPDGIANTSWLDKFKKVA